MISDAERQGEILEYLGESGAATVRDLADWLGDSLGEIREAVEGLLAAGAIRPVGVLGEYELAPKCSAPAAPAAPPRKPKPAEGGRRLTPLQALVLAEIQGAPWARALDLFQTAGYPSRKAAMTCLGRFVASGEVDRIGATGAHRYALAGTEPPDDELDPAPPAKGTQAAAVLAVLAEQPWMSSSQIAERVHGLLGAPPKSTMAQVSSLMLDGRLRRTAHKHGTTGFRYALAGHPGEEPPAPPSARKHRVRGCRRCAQLRAEIERLRAAGGEDGA